MRRKLASLLIFAWLLTACDPLALPVAPTPTATALPPTATVPVLTDTPGPLPTDTPQALATATAPGSAALETPTVSAQATVDDSEAHRELVDIESDTIKLRGLTPKSHVPEHFVSSAQIKTNLTAEEATSYPKSKAKQDAVSLYLLRLLDDPKLDLYQLQIDLLGEQVIGYYDEKKKELFVRSDQTSTLSPLARETLAHEFTHSLQDQYYDLQKMRPDNVENDKGTAITTLIEGDAQTTGMLYAQVYLTPDQQQQLITEIQNSSSTVLNIAPRYVRDSLTFPYDQGVEFITALAQSQPGSYKAINDALADPPISTEQVMHPEKYLNKPRDEPVQVSLPPLTSTLGSGWTFSESDTLGEFDFKEMFLANGINETQAPAGSSGAVSASDAAAGWGGARYALYQKGDAAVLLTDTRWDTRNDAAEFDSTLRYSLGSMKKDGNLWTDGHRYIGIKSAGQGVVMVSGTESDVVQKVLAVANP